MICSLRPRTHGQWLHSRRIRAIRVESSVRQWPRLYHRNMVGLMPAWEHLLKSGVAEKYEFRLQLSGKGPLTA